MRGPFRALAGRKRVRLRAGPRRAVPIRAVRSGLAARSSERIRLVGDAGEDEQPLVRRSRREHHDLHVGLADQVLGIVDHDHVAIGKKPIACCGWRPGRIRSTLRCSPGTWSGARSVARRRRSSTGAPASSRRRVISAEQVTTRACETVRENGDLVLGRSCGRDVALHEGDFEPRFLSSSIASSPRRARLGRDRIGPVGQTSRSRRRPARGSTARDRTSRPVPMTRNDRSMTAEVSTRSPPSATSWRVGSSRRVTPSASASWRPLAMPSFRPSVPSTHAMAAATGCRSPRGRRRTVGCRRPHR